MKKSDDVKQKFFELSTESAFINTFRVRHIFNASGSSHPLILWSNFTFFSLFSLPPLTQRATIIETVRKRERMMIFPKFHVSYTPISFPFDLFHMDFNIWILKEAASLGFFYCWKLRSRDENSKPIFTWDALVHFNSQTTPL